MSQYETQYIKAICLNYVCTVLVGSGSGNGIGWREWKQEERGKGRQGGKKSKVKANMKMSCIYLIVSGQEDQSY